MLCCGFTKKVFLTTFKEPDVSIKYPLPQNDVYDLRIHLLTKLNTSNNVVCPPSSSSSSNNTASKRAKFPGELIFV